MKKRMYLFAHVGIMVGVLFCALSCKSDDDEEDSLSPITVTNEMTLPLGKVSYVSVDVNKVFDKDTGNGISDGFDGTWTMASAPDSLYVMQRTGVRQILLLPASTGQYQLVFEGNTAAGRPVKELLTVTVPAPDTELSPYVARVVDVCPAPGQFTNVAPAWKEGQDYADVLADATERLVGKANGSDVCLGGFGGYIDLAFDHTIANIPGRRDFRVMGNSFVSDEVPTLDGYITGNSEPGVIMVALDLNSNGRPDDDEWYEIAGSEHSNAKTVRGYAIDYFRPATEQTDPDYKPGLEFITIKNYLRWTDNQGGSGYMHKNSFHTQCYYPGWRTEEPLHFSGTRLPDNAVDTKGDGKYFVLYCYEWGYADAMPNTHIGSAIDIEWAVDAQGNKAHLPGIDFVRIYTGVNQDCGWIGETSTEVSGVVDLHLTGVNLPTNGR